ncbi:hypothetical protein [Paraburkholderia rhynchosiae]|uniref:Uncharacterized protein n=1 Tax=Paraburkholderia rhynchosiae TaxID=487049 RepID=A0A6J5B5L7_9BURK|nr:hypothetical protein [Paraburkholderia rhynchosiae]CAB3693169.1 hypothetical protein LMG27174_03273 [Paraburkholderia rhynchosiae]
MIESFTGNRDGAANSNNPYPIQKHRLDMKKKVRIFYSLDIPDAVTLAVCALAHGGGLHGLPGGLRFYPQLRCVKKSLFRL